MPTPRRPSEFDLIAGFARLVERAGVRPRGLVVGVGDDAAVLRGDAEDLVVTQDALVEGRHFERRWFDPVALGWRAAAVNLSDVAAMGAQPRFVLVSLFVPSDEDPAWVRGVERGIVAHAARHGAAVVGGNVAGTDGPFVVDVTVLGACARGRAWRRRARAGDAIVVAGRLGDAALGLERLRADPFDRDTVVRAWRKPEPRLDVAAALAGVAAVHGAIDVSDGFAADLVALCRAAGVGCDVDAGALPVSRALRVHCAARDRDVLQYALGGGEDYALVLAVAPRRARAVLATVEALGVPAAIVGRFTARAGVHRLRRADGRLEKLEPAGWDHLRAG